MNLSYRTLERDYYKVLNKIIFTLNDKNGVRTSRVKLPYLLEKITLFRLKSNPYWIISAISGSGKTTISKQLEFAGFKKLPNVTTRLKRLGENNKEYIFVDDLKFTSLKKNNLLFYPHKRNGVWQAILKKDIAKLIKRKSYFYLDKSVASSLVLKKFLPEKVKFTLIYLLTPNFKELYTRILKREVLRKVNEKHLSKKEIFKRFKEEINDMKKSVRLSYVYIVNDSLDRVKKLLKKPIKNSMRRM